MLSRSDLCYSADGRDWIVIQQEAYSWGRAYGTFFPQTPFPCSTPHNSSYNWLPGTNKQGDAVGRVDGLASRPTALGERSESVFFVCSKVSHNF